MEINDYWGFVTFEPYDTYWYDVNTYLPRPDVEIYPLQQIVINIPFLLLQVIFH